MRFAASMGDVELDRHYGTVEDELIAEDVLELSQPKNKHREVYTTASAGYPVITPDSPQALLSREESRGAFSTSARTRTGKLRRTLGRDEYRDRNFGSLGFSRPAFG